MNEPLIERFTNMCVNDFNNNVTDKALVNSEQPDNDVDVLERSSRFMSACLSSKIPTFRQVSEAFDDWASEDRDKYRLLPKMTLGLQWALSLRYPFMYPDAMSMFNEQPEDIVEAVGKSARANGIECDINCDGVNIPSNPMALLKKQGSSCLDGDIDEDDNEKRSIWTFFDDFPHGWLTQFGLEMLEDLRNALIDEGGAERLFAYRVMQIKEKFGSLHFYANYDSDVTSDIMSCYEALSYLCCIDCGSFSHVRLMHGWITPVCYACWNRQYEGSFNDFLEHTNPGAPNGARESMGYTVYSTDGQRNVDLYDLYIGNNAKRIIRYGDNGEDCILADMISNNQGTKPSPLHVADIYERYIDEMNG